MMNFSTLIFKKFNSFILTKVKEAVINCGMNWHYQIVLHMKINANIIKSLDFQLQSEFWSFFSLAYDTTKVSVKNVFSKKLNSPRVVVLNWWWLASQ